MTSSSQKILLRLVVMVPVLLLIAWGSWYGVNALAARQLKLIYFCEIGDEETVAYICRWDQSQVSPRTEAPGWEDYYDGAPLHFARNVEIVKILLEAGADLSVTDSAGDTPLFAAIQTGRLELVKLFLDSGDDVNSICRGNSALHTAVLHHRVAVAKFLVAAGANVNSNAGISRGTPLHYAVDERDVELIRLVLEAGADVNATDENDETPLQLAYAFSHSDEARVLQILHLLLDAGANVNRIDRLGKTALDAWLSREGQELIRKHGGKTARELKAQTTDQGFQKSESDEGDP